MKVNKTKLISRNVYSDRSGIKIYPNKVHTCCLFFLSFLLFLVAAAAIDQELQDDDSVQREGADVHGQHNGVLGLLQGGEDARSRPSKVQEGGDEGELAR